MLILVAVGIALYSCNWPYFFEICTCSTNTTHTNVLDTHPSSSSDGNPSQQLEVLPKYEEIELQNIYHPNRFVSIDLTDDTPPPKYEDIHSA